MGFLSDIWDGIGSVTGIGGGGRVDPQTVDPAAYAELYKQALEQMGMTGGGGMMPEMRAGLEKQIMEQMGELDNNAAGRKSAYLNDMGDAFKADTQNIARATGGTGTLSMALRPRAGMYDAKAKATSRGLLDLQGQALNDLGKVSGMQSGLYSQDFSRNQSLANIAMDELNSRRGTLRGNAGAQRDADQQTYDRRRSTFEGLGQIAGRAASPHTLVGKGFGG